MGPATVVKRRLTGDEVQVSLPHNKLYGNDRKLYYSERERAVYQGMELTEPPSNPLSFATGLDGEPAPHRRIVWIGRHELCLGSSRKDFFVG